jgi:hypothetical protein
VIQEIAETRDREEIGCDECFEELDRFVTIQLSGLDTAEAMPLVQEHLHMCGDAATNSKRSSRPCAPREKPETNPPCSGRDGA